LNCVSVKWVTRIQNIFSTGKISALLLIIILGIYCLIIGIFYHFLIINFINLIIYMTVFIGRYQNFENVMEGSNYDPGKIAVAFYSGLFCYTGWSYLNYVVEELKEPTK